MLYQIDKYRQCEKPINIYLLRHRRRIMSLYKFVFFYNYHYLFYLNFKIEKGYLIRDKFSSNI